MLTYAATQRIADMQELKFNQIYAKNENQDKSLEKVNREILSIKQDVTKIKEKSAKPGKDGRDGKDSVSTHETRVVTKEKTIVKEKPLKGDTGEKAPRQLTQINPVTNNLETKYENETFWKLLVPCKKLLAGCDDR